MAATSSGERPSPTPSTWARSDSPPSPLRSFGGTGRDRCASRWLAQAPGSGPPPAPPRPAPVSPPLTAITSQDHLDGLKNPSRWLMYSGDYTGRRHSPLTQVTPANVNRLAAQWAFQAENMVPGRGFEGTPLMLDGVLYVTGNNNTAWAIDVAHRRAALALPAQPAAGPDLRSRPTRRTAASPCSAICCSWARSTRTSSRSIAGPASSSGTRPSTTSRSATPSRRRRSSSRTR